LGLQWKQLAELPRGDLCISSDGIEVAWCIGVVTLGYRTSQCRRQCVARGDARVYGVACRGRAIAKSQGVLRGSKELLGLREIGEGIRQGRGPRLCA
jgi:hypothetical protein